MGMMEGRKISATESRREVLELLRLSHRPQSKVQAHPGLQKFEWGPNDEHLLRCRPLFLIAMVSTSILTYLKDFEALSDDLLTLTTCIDRLYRQ